MNKRIYIFVGVTVLLGSFGLALVVQKSYAHRPARSNESTPFTIANVHFEQNAMTGNLEVVFEAKGGSEGLAKLTVSSPDGRTVVNVMAPDASTLGVKQFRFESPEPEDLNSLKSAYPEGVYTFEGITGSGEKLLGKDTLNHQLPAQTSFIQPEFEAANVATKNLKITWTPVKNLSAYIVHIEQDDLNVSLTARLPGSATAFDVPDAFLLPGTEYLLGIGTVTKKGNASFVETTFVTTKKE